MITQLESRKKEVVMNLYSSGIPVDIIAFQTDLDIPSVLQVIRQTESGEPEIFYSLRCPYCDSIFTNKYELSKHIDRIHTGTGLLEGDMRKW
ncbi:MAG: C2H2-type zinc finger protein [Nitrososphaerales archaeon]